jgi:hypothetical protein
MGQGNSGDVGKSLWFIKTGDIGVGPVSTGEMVAMLESGELTARTQVRRDGDGSAWQRIDSTPLMEMARQESAEEAIAEPIPPADGNEHGWFYGNQYDRKGPATRSDIKALYKAGSLDPQTLVWREGMEVWQLLHAGHWLLEDTATGKPNQFSYWEARANTVSPRQGWQPGTFTIAFGVIAAIVGVLFFIGQRETTRFQSLSPTAQYEERCRNSGMAVSMALTSIRLHLNIVDTPKFEQWGFDKFVKQDRNAANNCVFTIEDFVTFKNENGGQSRRHARVVLTPNRAEASGWILLSIAVR